ncbi:MAG: ORF6N domain-containing protein [Ruminococcus flavefaciens]|nr:ORF6N domain-containing protein [Ruminococcus flavefaciens]
MYEIINSVLIKIKEYNGQRVVTLKDIDMAHGRPTGTARKRFNDNRKHFIEGEDYFKVKCSEVRPFFGQTLPNGFNPKADIILMTENGYLMLVKSFTDDLSWQVQRQLVKTYFRAREMSNSYTELLEMYKNINKRFDRLEQKIDTLEYKADTSECKVDILEYKIDRLEKKVDIIAKHSDTIIKDIKKMVVDATNHVVIPCVSFLYDKFIK